MGHAFGTREKPHFDDPGLESLFQRGLEHEASYVDTLKAAGATRVVDLAGVHDALQQTIDAMTSGADVIVQGALGRHWSPKRIGAASARLHRQGHVVAHGK